MMSVFNTITMDDDQIKKFIELYGEGDGKFSLSLVLPEPASKKATVESNTTAAVEWRRKYWDTKIDATEFDGDLDLREILSGNEPFETAYAAPIKVYEKMAKDGLKFKIYWEAEDIADLGIGNGENRDGKFWHCIDFDETAEYFEERGEHWDPRDCAFVYHIDEYGNECKIDTSRTLIHNCLAVEVNIESGEVSEDCSIYKVPSYFESIYEDEDLDEENFSDYIRVSGEHVDNAFFLDKDGNNVCSYKDADHTPVNEDGWFCINHDLIGEGDAELDEDGEPVKLTPKALKKWRKILGLK